LKVIDVFVKAYQTAELEKSGIRDSGGHSYSGNPLETRIWEIAISDQNCS
jgi:hypothetical protein